jgi:hypothetical protein
MILLVSFAQKSKNIYHYALMSQSYLQGATDSLVNYYTRLIKNFIAMLDRSLSE